MLIRNRAMTASEKVVVAFFAVMYYNKKVKSYGRWRR